MNGQAEIQPNNTLKPSNLSSSTPTSNSTPYQTILTALLSHPHTFFSPPASPQNPHIPQITSSNLPTISSLSLHPVVESLLHILNADLPAAHFLCRHAEVSPKWESMYVHGILHRVEGDVENARCWYGDVRDREVFEGVWGMDIEGSQEGEMEVPRLAREEGWEGFLTRVEGWRDRSRRRRKMKAKEKEDTVADDNDNDIHPTNDLKDWDEEERLLRETSLWEIREVLKFCEKKFGTDALSVNEAKSEFLGRIESGKKEHAEVAQAMVTGGEGWRVW